MGTEEIPELNWLADPSQKINPTVIQQAQIHQNNLTKPAGSLGRLEELAVQFCGYQNSLSPQMDLIRIVVFAADHGVAKHSVSAYPQNVTREMLYNFVNGGAAISVLAQQLDAHLDVVNMGLVGDPEDICGVYDRTIAKGTADFSQQPAMTTDQLINAFKVGKEFAESRSEHLLIGGDMGIANTTSAAAIYSALLNCPPRICAGPGTGISRQGLQNKIRIIEQAIELHDAYSVSALEVLRLMGGFEIVALTAMYIRAAQQGKPIMVDGYIASAAALAAVKINPSVRQWLLFAHVSAEPAHKLALDKLDGKPLLDMAMRLGEASGAALAVPLVKSALQLHNQMATFNQAGVSDVSNN